MTLDVQETTKIHINPSIKAQGIIAGKSFWIQPPLRQQKTTPKTIIDIFISPKVTIGLFALQVCVLLPTTFSTELATALRIPSHIILALIGLNLAVCSLYRLKSLRTSTLIIHLGVLIILVGGLINLLGFVATINIYEGNSTDQVYRWDIEKDVNLGFDLRVAGINLDFYPIGVKIGVLKKGRKAGLVASHTGDSFVFEKYQIQIVSLNQQTKDLELAVQSLAEH